MRITVLIAVSMLAILIGFAVVILYDIKTFKEEMINSSIVHARLVGEYSVTPLAFEDRAGAGQILNKLQAIPFVSNASLFDENGLLFAAYHRSDERFTPPALRSEPVSYFAQGYLHLFQPISYNHRRYGTTARALLWDIREILDESSVTL